MTVALSDEAMYLKHELERLGHNVVAYGKYRGAIDAVVYKGVSMTRLSLSNSNFCGHNGVLVLDCTNRTASEIHNYLKYRSFSPIF